jgi:dephospho-CoA kinase
MSAPTSHSPARRTRHLGVTGGIGSGKSTLAAMLAQQGAVLIDADQISRSLTAAGGAAIPAIRAQFGAALIDADGALDRAQMRALVFSQPSARQQLEAIVHPLVAEHTAAQAQAAQAQGARCVVFDIPLLVESGHWPRQLDAVLVVDCDEAIQIERTMQRSGLEREAVQRIMATQASRAQRRAAADIVVDNSTLTLVQLRALAEQLARQLPL